MSVRSVSPEMTEIVAGTPPLKGMFFISTPPASLMALPASSPVAPATAIFSLPGWRFASAINSLTDFAGTEG